MEVTIQLLNLAKAPWLEGFTFLPLDIVKPLTRPRLKAALYFL